MWMWRLIKGIIDALLHLFLKDPLTLIMIVLILLVFTVLMILTITQKED